MPLGISDRNKTTIKKRTLQLSRTHTTAGLNAAIQVTDEVSSTKHLIPNILWQTKKRDKSISEIETDIQTLQIG